MDDIGVLEIPGLDDPSLMQLTACGRLFTKNPKVRRKVKALRGWMTARVGSKDSALYIQFFGNAQSSSRLHLHVDILIRPPEWAAEKELCPLAEIRDAIMQFAGMGIDVTIEGEFFVKAAKLPEDGIIRSAMCKTTHGGLTAKQTAQSLSISSGPIKELKWIAIDEKRVVVGIVAKQSTYIDSEYLRECESFIVWAFHTLILGGRKHVASHR